MADISEKLRRRWLADIERHADRDQAIRTMAWVLTHASLKSFGTVATAELFRDCADDLERDALPVRVQ